MSREMIWVLRDLNGIEQALGFLPEIFWADDPRPAAEQANERYAHGGGWQPQSLRRWSIKGAKLVYSDRDGDEVYEPLAFTVHPLTKEMIVIYDYSYVMIAQPEGGGFQIARMD